MSSEAYFEDDSAQLTPTFLAQVDALEAAFDAKPSQPATGTPNTGHISKNSDTIDYDELFDELDSEDLLQFDTPNYPLETAVAGARDANGAGSTSLRQTTLFGGLVEEPRATNSHRSHAIGKGVNQIKTWDYSRPVNSKAKKGKKPKVDPMDESDEDEMDDTFSHDIVMAGSNRFFAHARRPPPSFKHKPDLLLAKQWIYPTNKPKRDYQFNITREALFENTLVSLPTGLGKTFIAAVLMLNYYRWFPEGKVVFVAPTKPLVAQQIDACHKICGIPGSHSIELTGQTPRAKRADFWREKRVFFMTPQTFINDLKCEICNPTDIVLLVIDEAHRGTGDHAYAQIVRYLMLKNGHFRVLALTATPGSNTEAVQKIIDALHISHIEIRDENSFDLYQYVLPKKINTHVIKMSADIIIVRELLVKVMNKVAKKIVELGLMPGLDVVKLHPYRCTAVQNRCRVDGMSKKYPFIFGMLNKLRVLAQAMGYLIECSLHTCYNSLQGLLEDNHQEIKKSKLSSEPLFQEVIKELEKQNSKGFSIHPKVDKLVALALDYFAEDHNEEGSSDNSEHNMSRMMVFANYRSVVEEIVCALNQHQPLIRATRFVGQGADKHGNKGISQRDQLDVIKRFKDGEFNVLVATSIGEEGLDIGEIDCIICYDAQKTPIRMLQRIGRTGRRRAGRVEVLLSESREETNWEKARSDYENVQKSITRGDSLQLFADVERLLPSHLRPVCQEMLMPIEHYTRETRELKKCSSSPKGKKRKAESALGRNIPAGAIDGFVPSSKLLARTSNKKFKITSPTQDDDSTTQPARSRAAKPVVKKRRKGKKLATEHTLSQLAREAADDSEDRELELGIEPVLKSKYQTLPQEPPFVMPIDSSDPDDVVEEQPPHEQIEDHSWLLDSDPIDTPTHESSDKLGSHSFRPLVIPHPSSPRPTHTLGSRHRRRIASEHDQSSRSTAAPNPRPAKVYLDLEAEVSGEYSSDEHVEEVERESDQRFLEELSPTQRLSQYNQNMAYRQSLFTQIIPNAKVPKFNSNVIRKGFFGPARLPCRIPRTSSPKISSDQYSIDSFLVEDDDDILLNSHSSGL